MTKLALALLCCVSLISHKLSAFEQQKPNEQEAKENEASEQALKRQNILRGSVTPERSWWDLQHYDLSVAVDIGEQRFSGANIISYKAIAPAKRFQLELQPPMVITSVSQNNKLLDVEQEGYSYFVNLQAAHEIGQEYQLTVEFSGVPHQAIKAPWDGGVTWSEDSSGMPFVATSNQGIGASIWWPNKDHGYDEPDRGIDMHIEVPQPLVNVSNGRLVNIEEVPENSSRIYHWQVKSPINNYGVNINIADYVNFSEQYQGENGRLDMDYYVLRENEEVAKTHFKDAIRAMQALEHWFGPYPFYQDSFKLVEVPYLGMEHQSSVTYGNEYKMGYKGRDLSRTGWGLKWDYIIIHEAAHEWFANNITAQDVADIWIQESFTTYAEGLFVEYHYGKAAGNEYIQGLKYRINNKAPLISEYGINKWGSRDVYAKGALLLHSIRQIIDDDVKWRNILRGLNKTFYHQTVTSGQIEAYLIEHSEKSLVNVFEQYLRDARLPILEYSFHDNKLMARWNNTIETFDMPMRVTFKGENAEQQQWLNLTTKWQEFDVPSENLTILWDEDFYYAMNAL